MIAMIHEEQQLKDSLIQFWEEFKRFEKLPIDSRKLILEFVEFFKLTSRFQDEVCIPNDSCYDELRTLINRIGRRPDGFNRAKADEVISVENIFLGNKHCLPVMSVAKWLEEGNPDELAILSHTQVRELIISSYEILKVMIPELLKKM